MSKQTIIWISVIAIVVIAFVVLFMYKPDDTKKEIIPANWEPDYQADSKEPYGGYLFYELLKNTTADFEFLKGQPNEYLSELPSYGDKRLLVVYDEFYLNLISTWSEINEFVYNGNSVLFILEKDPANLKYFYGDYLSVTNDKKTTEQLYFINDKKKYEFQFLVDFEIENYNWKYFRTREDITIPLDTIKTGDKIGITAQGRPDSIIFVIHEKNKENEIVFIEIPYGNGSIFIHRTPMAFTNMALLEEKNVEHLEKVLSKINYNSVIGNVKNDEQEEPRERKARISPIQFILSNAALRWAYYLSLVGLLVFAVFNLKRKQAAIPVTPNRSNSTLEFADALSKVYFQRHNNHTIVAHKQRIFTTFIRTRYHIHPGKDKNEYARLISAKSGMELEKVNEILNTTEQILKFKDITDQRLIDLHKLLDNFYKNCK